MAHTRDARMRIFASRPAAIQVNYFGYAGTTGSDVIDYIIGDAHVLPCEHTPFYSEKIVHLPEGFFAHDSKRGIAEATPSRREAGLPERGFVFCCFNNSVKIQPTIFDIWMRLLRTVPDSVLWLSLRNPSARENLRREAQARGIDAERLVFARHVPRIEDHLARHRLADLFLDTMPYNAHATAVDALWAGLPVLTCTGNAFASRVGASLLAALNLPELITTSLVDYEALALRLAKDTAFMAGIRQKLARHRRSEALFNTNRLRRHIEAAYTTMWDIYQRGERPRSFAVPILERDEADAIFAAAIST
jgi:predicted O-linked N-acetylglucosamine transferase (SPINDLY family)